MSIAVRLSDKIVKDVRIHAELCHRSVPKQIEFWVKVGKAAEDNPDLPYDFIKGILLAKEEVQRGEVEEYTPDSL
jgi:hypothetical protein